MTQRRCSGPAVGRDAGGERLGALLGEQEQHPVAAQLVVVDDGAHGAGHVTRLGPPLLLDVVGRPLEGGLDQPLPGAEVAQHGLHADACLRGDVGQRDVRRQPAQVQRDRGLEHPSAGLLDGGGARRHPVGPGRRVHDNGR